MKYRATLLLIFLLASSVIRSQTTDEADSLYLNYEFDKAIELCQNLATRLTKARKADEAEALSPLIEKYEKGARMLRHCEDVQIIDSLIVDKARFLQAYFISSEAGYLEEENGQLYYINQLGDKRYFSRENKEGYGRIYSELEYEGQWDDRALLNLPYEAGAGYAFPFVMPDGITLYFASTGHGSLGGYDLFVSRYNSAGDAYLAPTQLGMPFNSPYNDYMLAIDEVNNIGFFATDRFMPEGQVVVYTYIPNASVKPIDSDDPDYLAKRARIYDIRDSWQENRSYYNNYIQQVKDFIRDERKTKGYDFTFVINDNIIYHTLDDFVSTAARQQFRQLQSLDTNIGYTEAELDAQRKEYSRASAEGKAGMKTGIEENEHKLLTLQKQRVRMETEVRNLEIREIRTKN